ncbi:MAG: histidinol-phosphate transaminase [Kiritimatiellia bacterium]
MSTYVKNSIRKMKGYTPGEQPPGDDLIKLNTNENPYPPSPKVQKVLEGLKTEALRKYPDPACTALRRSIADLHGVSAEAVIIGNGSDEILALCATAFVEEGGAVGYFTPSYSLYPVLADIAGHRKREIELDADFKWPWGGGDRTEAGNIDCALFYMTNPNAPTGIRYPAERVSAFCKAFKGVVVIDEAYVDFADGHCMELATQLPNVLVTRTLSKSYSLAGLRAGYAVGTVELIEALMKIKDSYNVNAVSQAAAIAAISDSDHMLNNVKRIRRTRETLVGTLKELGFSVYPSEANFVWAMPPKVSAENLYLGLKSLGVLIRYFPGTRTGAFVRITVGTDEETASLLKSLKSVLASCSGKETES